MNKILNYKSAMRLSICLIALLVVGCDITKTGDVRVVKKMATVCAVDTIDKRSEFILQCILNANPHSDEEPEDWIPICKKMAEALYCQMEPVLSTEVKPPYAGWNVHKVEPVKEKE